MRREIIITADGSPSISIPDQNVTYHSIHGAVQESLHVFIKAGFEYLLPLLKPDSYLNILEMGFGTGLNAWLTFIETLKTRQSVHYTAIELFPLQKEEYEKLNYTKTTDEQRLQPLFQQLHTVSWETDAAISPDFILHKTRQSLLGFKSDRLYDLIYFDAFAPASQPELWTVDVFRMLYNAMSVPSVLVTYCSKGDVRRALQAAGFTVQKIPGPPRKREMLRAVKS